MIYNTIPIFGDGQYDFELVGVATSDMYKTLAVCGNVPKSPNNIFSSTMIEQWNI